MNLVIGMILGTAAQLLTFVQLQGRWKFDWMKENPWWVVLLGLPISYLFMASVQHMVTHFEGQLWPSRLIGFAVGTIVFTFMSILWFNEPINTKTAVCLGLSICILLVQLFWK
jgi:multidrug transporter EmrE-like cation transporter